MSDSDSDWDKEFGDDDDSLQPLSLKLPTGNKSASSGTGNARTTSSKRGLEGSLLRVNGSGDSDETSPALTRFADDDENDFEDEFGDAFGDGFDLSRTAALSVQSMTTAEGEDEDDTMAAFDISDSDDEDWDANLGVKRTTLSLPGVKDGDIGLSDEEVPGPSDEVQIKGIKADKNAEELWDDDFEFAEEESGQDGIGLKSPAKLVLRTQQSGLFGGSASSNKLSSGADMSAVTKAVAVSRKILREFAGTALAPKPVFSDASVETSNDQVEAIISKLRKKVSSASDDKQYRSAARDGIKLAELYLDRKADYSKASKTLTSAFRALRKLDTKSEKNNKLTQRVLFLMGRVAVAQEDLKGAIDSFTNSASAIADEPSFTALLGETQLELAKCLARTVSSSPDEAVTLQDCVSAFVDALKAFMLTPKSEVNWPQVAECFLGVGQCLRSLRSMDVPRTVQEDVSDAAQQALQRALTVASGAHVSSIQDRVLAEIDELQADVESGTHEAADVPSPIKSLQLKPQDKFPDDLSLSDGSGNKVDESSSDDDWDAEFGLDAPLPVQLKLGGVPSVVKTAATAGGAATVGSQSAPSKPNASVADDEHDLVHLLNAIPKRYRLLHDADDVAIVKYPKSTLLWSIKTREHPDLEVPAGHIFMQEEKLVEWLRTLVSRHAPRLWKAQASAAREHSEDNATAHDHEQFGGPIRLGGGLPRLSCYAMLNDKTKPAAIDALFSVDAEPTNLQLENIRQEFRHKLQKAELHTVAWAQAYLDHVAVLFATEHLEELWETLNDFFLDLRIIGVPKGEISPKRHTLHSIVFQVLYIACKVWRPDEDSTFRTFIEATRKLGPSVSVVADMFQLELRCHFEYDLESADFTPVVKRLCEIMEDHDPDSAGSTGVTAGSSSSQHSTKHKSGSNKKVKHERSPSKHDVDSRRDGTRMKKSKHDGRSKHQKRSSKKDGKKQKKERKRTVSSAPPSHLELLNPVRSGAPETDIFTDSTSIFVRAAVDLHFLLYEISPLTALHRDLDAADRAAAGRASTRDVDGSDTGSGRERAASDGSNNSEDHAAAAAASRRQGGSASDEIVALSERHEAYLDDFVRMTKVLSVYPSMAPSVLKARAAYALAHHAVYSLEDFVLAEQLFLECVYVLDSLRAPADGIHPVISELGCNALLRYGEVLLQNDKYAYSIVSLEAGVASLRLRRSRKHHSYTALVRQIASITLEHRDTRRAIEYQREILDTYAQGHKFNEVILVCERISRLYREIGNFQRAEQFLWNALHAVQARRLAQEFNAAKHEKKRKGDRKKGDRRRGDRAKDRQKVDANAVVSSAVGSFGAGLGTGFGSGTLRAGKKDAPAAAAGTSANDLLLSFGESTDRIDPSSFRLHDRLVDLYLESFQPDRGIEMLEALSQMRLTQQQRARVVLPKLARSYIARRWFSLAEEVLDFLDRANNVTHDHSLAAVDGKDQANLQAMAMVAAASAESCPEECLQFWDLSVRFFRASGKYADALYCADQAIELCPSARLGAIAGYLHLRGKIVQELCVQAGSNAIQFPRTFEPTSRNLQLHYDGALLIRKNIGPRSALSTPSVIFTCTGDLIRECVCSYDRAFHYYRAIQDDVHIAKLTANIAETYLQHVFPPVAMLRLPMSEVSLLSPFEVSPMARRDGSGNPEDFIISFQVIEGPACVAREVVADMVHIQLAPQVYLNMAELHFLRGDRTLAMGFWAAARQIIEQQTSDGIALLSQRAPIRGYARLARNSKRLVRMLMCFEPAIINQNLHVIDLHFNVHRALDQACHAPFRPSLVQSYKAVSALDSRPTQGTNTPILGKKAEITKQPASPSAKKGHRRTPSDAKPSATKSGNDSQRRKRSETLRPRVESVFRGAVDGSASLRPKRGLQRPPNPVEERRARRIEARRNREQEAAKRLAQANEDAATRIWGLLAAAASQYEKSMKGHADADEVQTEGRRIALRISQARRAGDEVRAKFKMKPKLDAHGQGEYLNFAKVQSEASWLHKMIVIVQIDELLVSYVPATQEMRVQRMGGQHESISTNDSNSSENSSMLYLHLHMLSSMYEYVTLLVNPRLTLDKILHMLANTPYWEEDGDNRKGLFSTVRARGAFGRKPRFVDQTKLFHARLESLTSLLAMRSYSRESSDSDGNLRNNASARRHRMLTPAELSQIGIAKRATLAPADGNGVSSVATSSLEDVDQHDPPASPGKAPPRSPAGSGRFLKSQRSWQMSSDQLMTEDGIALLPNYVPITTSQNAQADISIADCFSEEELRGCNADSPLRLYLYLRGNSTEYEAHTQSQVLNRTVFLSDEMIQYLSGVVTDVSTAGSMGGESTRDQLTTRRVVEDLRDYVFGSLVAPARQLVDSDGFEPDPFFRGKLPSDHSLVRAPVAMVCSKALHAFPWELMIDTSVIRAASITTLVRQNMFYEKRVENILKSIGTGSSGRRHKKPDRRSAKADAVETSTAVSGATPPLPSAQVPPLGNRTANRSAVDTSSTPAAKVETSESSAVIASNNAEPSTTATRQMSDSGEVTQSSEISTDGSLGRRAGSEPVFIAMGSSDVPTDPSREFSTESPAGSAGRQAGRQLQLRTGGTGSASDSDHASTESPVGSAGRNSGKRYQHLASDGSGSDVTPGATPVGSRENTAGREEGKRLAKIKDVKRRKSVVSALAPKTKELVVPSLFGFFYDADRGFHALLQEDKRCQWVETDMLNQLHMRSKTPTAVRTSTLLMPLQSSVLRHGRKPTRKHSKMMTWINLMNVHTVPRLLDVMNTSQRQRANPLILIAYADVMEPSEAIERLMSLQRTCTFVLVPHKKYAQAVQLLSRLREDYLKEGTDGASLPGAALPTPYAWLFAALAVVQSELDIALAVFNPPLGVASAVELQVS